MMTRSIVTALFISLVCLLVIGGPIANALFESPLPTSEQTARAFAQTDSLTTLPVAQVGWIILGAAATVGFVLTVSRRSSAA